jgi:hypothetical protein
MATISAGITSKPHGVLGPYKFRIRADGSVQFFPRYPRDKRSPAQLEARRRFSAIAKRSSLCYLVTLKPFWRRPSVHYNAFARSIQRSLPRYEEAYGIPRFFCGGEYELQSFGASFQFDHSTGNTYFTYRYSGPHKFKDGDKVYLAIEESDNSFRVSQAPAVWPVYRFLIGKGDLYPGRRTIAYSYFVAREELGLYDLLSYPQWTYNEYLPYRIPVPIVPA